MTFVLRTALLAAFVFAIDWYFFQAVSTVFRSLSATKRAVLFWIYWGFTALSLLMIILPLLYPFQYWPKGLRVYAVSLVMVVMLSKIVGILFVAIDDIIRLVRWLWQLIAAKIRSAPAFTQPTDAVQNTTPVITRWEFLNQVALGVALLPMASLLYGMVRGAFNYTVHNVNVPLPHLPEEFDGLKIVHISDLHLGSFTSPEPLQKAVSIIKAQNPDVIFFTGDLVNNEAQETAPFMDILRSISAPMGVFSTIGNHDYGDYMQWDSIESKRQNFQRLQRVHAEVGWTLLMNEHRVLERNGAQIAILGVENWGAAMNFPKRGDLSKAYQGTEKHTVKLLLSHDPSHWNAQVTQDFPDIDITFSGHTHGAQFGVEIPGFRWSPVQYFYKQWAGLYRQEYAASHNKMPDNDSGRTAQYLYVNRGLGFLGYPGRVGISPEITVLTLHKA
jgi:predicted MPP superfamily phosphohydrolase